MTVDSEPAGTVAGAVVGADAAKATRLPAQLLAQASVLPAVFAAGWLVAALPLLVVHAYRPWAAIPLGIVVAGLLLRPAWRAAAARARTLGSVPWWTVAGVLAVVVGFAVLSYVTSAGDVLVRRDPGSYAMSATWLTHHGTIEMPANAAAFGGARPGLDLVSQGFYLHGSHIIPQFMTGVPVLLSVAGWIAGVSGVLHANAFLGALSLLAFAGLATRLVGARWAPLATLVLALAQPELDVLRAAYSEPGGQLLMLGGFALVLDALALARVRFGRELDDPDATGQSADVATGSATGALFVGGLVMGLVTLVRIDAVADLLPFVPYLALLVYHRVRAWKPLFWGLLAGLAAGTFDGVVLTLPYVKHVGGNLWLALGGMAFLIVVCAVLVWSCRRGWLSWVWRVLRRPPEVAAVLVGLGGLAFVVRPYVQTARSDPHSGGAYYVEQVQRILGMKVDPTRSYYEDAARWLSWYFGWAALAIALLAAMWLTREVVAGRRRQWLPALLVFLGTAAAVLARPSITPDHPWADRRFVPVVLPAVALLAFAGIAQLLRRIDATSWQPASRRAAQLAAFVALGALVVVPTWLGSRQVFTLQTEKGEVALVHQVCAQLHPNDVVLAFGGRAETEWPGTLRIMCGVPSGTLSGGGNTLAQLISSVQARGGRVMALVSSSGDKSSVPGLVDWPAQPTASLVTNEVGHTLVTRPDAASYLPFEMWLGQIVNAS